jgi:hypothetical protein
MDKNMKKTILASLTVAAALVASAPLAKANAFLELISGSYSTSTTVSGSSDTASFTGLTLGSWDVDIEANGSGHALPILSVGLNTYASGHPTNGLTVYFSSGSYNATGGIGLFSASQSGDQLAATASLFTSSSLYTGSGSEGTQFMSTLGLPIAASGNTNESSAFAGGSALYVTDELDFGGGAGATLGGAQDNMNVTASFNVSVPDGGLTMTMLGSSILLLAGIRSRLSKKS